MIKFFPNNINLWRSCVLLILRLETPDILGLNGNATFVKKDKIM